MRPPSPWLPRGIASAALAFALGACGGGAGGGVVAASTAAPVGSTAPAPVGAGGAGAAPTAPAIPVAAQPGTTLGLDFTRSRGLYDAPFPCESLRRQDGGVDVSRLPNPTNKLFVRQVQDVLHRDARGFGTTSGVFFRATGPLDPARLPGLHDTVGAQAPVFLVDVDARSPDLGRRYPVRVAYAPDGGPHGDAHLLSLIPLQGVPLREGTLHAAVVLRALGDAAGAPLGVPQALADLANGAAPPGLVPPALDRYREALGALARQGVSPHDVAGLAVFETDRPTAAFEAFCAHALARPLPAPQTPLRRVDEFPGYVLLESTLRLPVYQHGRAPFLTDGGGWRTDAQGAPALAGEETARLLVTIPRAPMPPGGFPVVVVVRTGFGNGPRGFVDRGRHPTPGGGAPAGSGPAAELAAAGFAAVCVDGPHGGLRNASGLDEQVLMFNPANPEAMRDNVRQSALEVVLVGALLDRLAIDPAECPGTTVPAGAPVRLDAGTAALFGHSMGATIAPLALALQPRFRAAILSGAGGSWLENVLHKATPVAVRPAAELILGYPQLGRRLTEHDPVLSLLQWAGEGADPPVFARLATHDPRHGDPRHVLMLQGVADTYIPPPVANALSLAFGLDLAGPSLDAVHPLHRTFKPLRALLGLAGRRELALPAGANAQGPSPGRAPFTAIVCQHPEDGLEDGHEVVFQTDAPKRQYRAFLRDLAAGRVPQVP